MASSSPAAGSGVGGDGVRVDRDRGLRRDACGQGRHRPATWRAPAKSAAARRAPVSARRLWKTRWAAPLARPSVAAQRCVKHALHIVQVEDRPRADRRQLLQVGRAPGMLDHAEIVAASADRSRRSPPKNPRSDRPAAARAARRVPHCAAPGPRGCAGCAGRSNTVTLRARRSGSGRRDRALPVGGRRSHRRRSGAPDTPAEKRGSQSSAAGRSGRELPA